MNIGLFTDCYLPTKNGVATAIAQTKQELERRGHKVVVLTVAYPADDRTRDWNRGCAPAPFRVSRSGGQCERPAEASIPEGGIYRFPSLPFRSDIELRLGLLRQATVDRIVVQEQLDLIHTHTEFSLGRAGKRAALRSGLPLIHTLHTLYPDYRHYLPLGRLLPVEAINGLLASFLTGYTLVVCPSEKSCCYVSSVLPAIRTAVIPNGVAVERFDPQRVAEADRDRARAGLRIGPADRVILYVGRLAQEKRVLPLLTALFPLLRTDANCRAVFVGSGPARGELAAAARAAGLGGQVLFTGPVEWGQMAAIYAVTHAFVTVSLSEVHPMTLIEAAMCGLPIVARRDVSFSDLVLDGFNGFLVDSDAAIAGKLAALLEDESVRRAFGANSQTLAGRFTVEAHVDRLEAFYREVLHHRIRKVYS